MSSLSGPRLECCRVCVLVPGKTLLRQWYLLNRLQGCVDCVLFNLAFCNNVGWLEFEEARPRCDWANYTPRSKSVTVVIFFCEI